MDLEVLQQSMAGTQMGPRIGIPLPTSHDVAYNDRCWIEYAQAVLRAGGDPIQLPLEPAAGLSRLAATCLGYVLPGSPADVGPELYGEARIPETAAPDADRERCDTWLLEHAIVSGKPVLGICYGAQFLNVWRGGSLVQDLLPVPVNHSAGGQVAVAHTALVVGRSLLGALLPSGEAPPAESGLRRLPVNSSHHQAISVAGEGLQVVARSREDGVVEAVEGLIGASQVIGVQWHPERSVEISPSSRALFLWLVSAASDLLGEKSRSVHGDDR